jgi:hypothetical protein
MPLISWKFKVYLLINQYIRISLIIFKVLILITTKSIGSHFINTSFFDSGIVYLKPLLILVIYQRPIMSIVMGTSLNDNPIKIIVKHILFVIFFINILLHVEFLWKFKFIVYFRILESCPIKFQSS